MTDTQRPDDVVRRGLEDREWDCMCDPGSHEPQCYICGRSLGDAHVHKLAEFHEALQDVTVLVEDRCPTCGSEGGWPSCGDDAHPSEPPYTSGHTKDKTP